jgi:hypothetical protein
MKNCGEDQDVFPLIGQCKNYFLNLQNRNQLQFLLPANPVTGIIHTGFSHHTFRLIPGSKQGQPSLHKQSNQITLTVVLL